MAVRLQSTFVARREGQKIPHHCLVEERLLPHGHFRKTVKFFFLSVKLLATIMRESHPQWTPH
jgi:hypothetical protein